MPPKRRAPTGASSSSSSSSKTAPPPQAQPKKRASKLAKENNLTPDQEAEILDAFALFATPDPSSSSHSSDSKEGVIKTDDVRRCLIALNTPPSSTAELREILETLDPLHTGTVTYPHFLAVAALKLHAKHNSDPDTAAEELEAAFRLFTKDDGSDVITVAHLRRVARELREDVGDRVLEDMIREANGGLLGHGVGRGEFEEVMRRAGIFA